MLRLNQIFLYHLFLLLTLLFFIVSAVSYFALEKIEIDHYKKSLKNSIILIEPQIKEVKDLDKFVKKLKSKTGMRFTIVNKNGKVIAESDYKKEDMENHANRPEIVKAKKSGWGDAVRYSNTLKENFLYVAKKIDLKKSELFIRTSISLKKITQNFYNLWIKFLSVFALFILFALVISYFFSFKIKKEIDKIIDYLEAIAKKDFSKKLKVNFAKEFEEIGKYLEIMSKRLKKREEKKDKYTKKLKKISRQRSELISAISHEFKNPVAIINGYAQTLLEDENIDKSLRKKFLEKIYNASNKISNMIDRLSIAIKFENEDLIPNKTEFDICSLAKEAVKLMKDKYKDREIILECEPSKVFADKTMIETVIVNLLDNALKYSESEVKILIKNKEVKIIDKGIGINEDDLEKITKKFYRAKKNTWDNSIGLGLYLVSYILKLHNSELKIDSTYKKGSVFSFKL